MNERIRELALDAGLLNYVDNETPRRYFIHGHADLEEVQKFAELIVRECILTIQMGITRDGHNTEKYLRSIKHIKQIKEHFGVEE